jgi:hypothetical protein
MVDSYAARMEEKAPGKAEFWRASGDGVSTGLVPVLAFS